MKAWVREGGKMYYGSDMLKTMAFWKVMGFLVGIPAAVIAGLVFVDRLNDR